MEVKCVHSSITMLTSAFTKSVMYVCVSVWQCFLFATITGSEVSSSVSCWKTVVFPVGQHLVRAMYCLQWLIPVLLLPKPVNPAFLYNHAMFVVLYLVGFVLERRPCAICSLVFATALFLICYGWSEHCVIWPCEPNELTGGDSVASSSTG